MPWEKQASLRKRVCKGRMAKVHLSFQSLTPRSGDSRTPDCGPTHGPVGREKRGPLGGGGGKLAREGVRAQRPLEATCVHHKP